MSSRSQTLEQQDPDLASQWHPARNGNLGPGDVAPASNKNVWWLGPCGHEWSARVANRTRLGSGCPYCAGKATLPGFNDLATTHPGLAAEWHPDNDLRCTRISAGSGQRVRWIGACGHAWTAAVKDRASKRSGCPYCAGKATLPGFNDLATTHPGLAAEWHPERNADLSVCDVTAGSKASVWWLCPLGHSWNSTPNRRTSRTVHCPVCSGHRVVAGINDLATTHPEVARQWHPTRNPDLSATQVGAGSNKRVWWLREECGHEWAAYVYDRAGSKATGCPRCANHVSRGEDEVYQALLEIIGPNAVIERNSRLDGYEIDLLVRTDDGTLAIEFNGLFWHSEGFRGRDYHRAKRSNIVAGGHRFFAVWEDDWRDRRDVVVRSLAHRLGMGHRVSGQVRVGARSLSVVKVARADASKFLSDHHLQGAAPAGCSFLGLAQGEALRALLAIRPRGDGIWEIIRYATSGSVPGGFSRLVRAAERSVPVTEWVTFADQSVSEGNLYVSNGFVVTDVLPPDYTYAGNRNGWRREHKSNYRLDRFRDDPTLDWKDGATERELATANGLHRIFDHGKIRYSKTVL